MPAGGAAPEGARAALPREPLFWAALAAFSGTVIGLLGTVRQATLGGSFYVDPAAQLLAQVPGFLGEALVVASSLGAVYLAWNALGGRGRRFASLGISLLALLLLAEAVGIVASVYWGTGERWQGYAAFPFPTLEIWASWAVVSLAPIVLLLFAVLVLLAREGRLGGLLCVLFVLSLPFGALRYWLAPPEPTGMIEPTTELVASALGWYPAGVSLLEAPLWVLLGAVLLRRARSRAGGEAFRTGERQNLGIARCLYEGGLGRGDHSVLDGLVSEDFRDLKRGSRGKLAMERVFSDLRRSYPDLAVSIERQEAEDDLVRTRVVLSGTDRGGVLWYPPTGKHVAFAAEFVDRFSDGRLIEHSGEADTEDLLRQLGLPGTHAPSSPEPEGEAAERGAPVAREGGLAADVEAREGARPEGRARKADT